MQKELSQVVENLQGQPQYQRIFESSTVFIIREDGLILWASGNRDQQSSTYGVLMGAAWKAAQAMVELNPGSSSLSSNDLCRLSFDTSDAGIYIVPTTFLRATLFIGMLFQNEVNPGLRKNQLRNFSRQLSSWQTNGREGATVVKTLDTPPARLFHDISDSEIDQLFSTVGS